jgi:transcriptional regulator of arginine metabolism
MNDHARSGNADEGGTARREAIVALVEERRVASQDELAKLLRQRGIRATQATLSRDLKELGVGRVAFGEGTKYVLQPAAEVRILRPLVGAEVLSIQSNESLIVVRTLPGCANVVGEYLDAQKHPDIIGTLAGDNTLLIIPRSQKKTKPLLTFLQDKLIEGK